MVGNHSADESLWIQCCLEAFRSLKIGASAWKPPAKRSRYGARMFGYARIYLVIHDPEYPEREKQLGYVTLTAAGQMDLYGTTKLTRLVQFARKRARGLFSSRRGQPLPIPSEMGQV